MAEKLDKYGNPIPKHGQGWGIDKDDPEYRNEQGYNADGSKGRWFSRSCAVCSCIVAFSKKYSTYCVLAIKRGSGAIDYKGYWCLPCGYLDYNETAKEAAARETFEETGLNLALCDFVEAGYSTEPTENRQNVVFFFKVKLGMTEHYTLSKDYMEKDEVEEIKWIPLCDIDEYKWAFDNDEVTKQLFDREIQISLTDKKFNFWKQ